MKDFDKVGLIKQAWEIVKKNYKLIAMLMAVFIGFQVIHSAISGYFKYSALSTLISLALTVVSLFLQIGFIKIVLKLIDGKAAEFNELWAYPQYLLKFIGASLLYGLIVLAGFVLLIVPGIYLALRLQFYSYNLVDRDMGVVDSLKASWEMTRGNVMNIFLFALLLVVLNIAGAIVLLVGLLVTIPVSFVAAALLYRRLQK